ncbi:MAG: type I-E CRISPR-associated protein Cas7/Cse4/CasC [Candidatus Latescibacterota bacterium]|jgi:CRISPR system Cascade subunit CasC
MELIELHILQSFPVSCLNRDDVGAPKTAVFGGVPRARVSSQCWKRAIRLQAQQAANGSRLFGGHRSRRWVQRLTKALEEHHVAEAQKAAELAIGYLASSEEAAKGAMVYLTPHQLKALAESMAKGEVEFTKGKKVSCKPKNALTGILGAVGDWADIAIFGRMVANDHTLTLEGAGMFSHALSTHRVSNEIDFFTAVDDLPDEEGDSDSAGAAHMGTLEFNSACYYRYVGLNLTLLGDEEHLGDLPAEDRRTAVDTFLRAAVEAVPGARHNSMFANTLPQHILGLYRSSGQPLSLANAFEEPVWSNDGVVAKSREALLGHYGVIKKTYDITAVEYHLPEITLAGLMEGLAGHVH